MSIIETPLQPPPAAPPAAERRRAARRKRPASLSVGGAVGRFAVTCFLVLLLVGLGAVEVLGRAGRSEAVRDARVLGQFAAKGVIAPAITPGLLRGDPAAIAAMDRVVRHRVLGGSVMRVKIWDARGRIVYSDEHRLIGSTFGLDQEERDALGSGRPAAEVSDLGAPENRYERRYGKLMEVYVGVRGRQGPRVLFETYQRYSSVISSGRRIWRALLPVLLGALLLLAVLQVPLVWSLARRLKRSERDRLRSLERAIDASEHERRRIAGDLHDGVVQNLAGISFRLGAARGMTDEDTPPELTRAVEESVAETRESIRALRSLLVDIYPPSLEREGLVAALSDLMSRTGDRRLTAHLHVVDDDVTLPPAIEALLFRVAQEALRNVLAHAHATDVLVWLQRHPDRVELSVTDDGQGFDVERDLGARDGHLGLVSIEDLVLEHGGRMHIKSVRGGGTALRVEVPLP